MLSLCIYFTYSLRLFPPLLLITLLQFLLFLNPSSTKILLSREGLIFSRKTENVIIFWNNGSFGLEGSLFGLVELEAATAAVEVICTSEGVSDCNKSFDI